MNNPRLTVRRLPEGAEGERSNIAAIREVLKRIAQKYDITLVEESGQEDNCSANLRPVYKEEMDAIRTMVPDIKTPRTYGIEKLGTLELPVMVKFQGENSKGGRHKYLIETDKQRSTLINWMGIHGNPEEWIVQEVIQCPGKAHSSVRVFVTAMGQVLASSIQYGAVKGKEVIAKKERITEEIKVDRKEGEVEEELRERVLNAMQNTQYSVPGSEKGLGHYEYEDSTNKWVICYYKFNVIRPHKNRIDDLMDPESEHYLDSKVAASNRMFAQGYGKHKTRQFRTLAKGGRTHSYEERIGGRIVLNPLPSSHRYNEEEQGILRAYGMPCGRNGYNSPELPIKLEDWSKKIAKGVCLDEEGGTLKEMWVGIDYMYDEKRGEWVLLEVNRRPGTADIRDKLGSVEKVDKYKTLNWATDQVLREFRRWYDKTLKST